MAKLIIKDSEKKDNPEWKNSKDKKRYQAAEDSIPVDTFTIIETNAKGKNPQPKTITKISIVRGHDSDCIGWTF